MTFNQLSKREYKYRCKIIAECHLKKGGQKFLDNYIREAYITYKEFYLDKECMGFFRAVESVTEASAAFEKFSTATKELNTSCEKMINAINEEEKDYNNG